MGLQHSVCLASNDMMTGTASHQTDCFHFGHLAKQLQQSWITFSRKHWSSLMLLLLQQTKILIKGIQGLGRDHRHISASLTSSTTFPCRCSYKCTLNTTLNRYYHKPPSYIRIFSKQLQPFALRFFPGQVCCCLSIAVSSVKQIVLIATKCFLKCFIWSTEWCYWTTSDVMLKYRLLEGRKKRELAVSPKGLLIKLGSGEKSNRRWRLNLVLYN